MRQQAVEALQQILAAQRRLPFLGLVERDDLAFGIDQQRRREAVNAETADDAEYAVRRGLRPGEFVLFEPGFDLRQYLRIVGVHLSLLLRSNFSLASIMLFRWTSEKTYVGSPWGWTNKARMAGLPVGG